MENGQFRSKIKNAKNIRKLILQDYTSSSVQKTIRKNTKYWRNETILKIGHLAKAIAHAKGLCKMVTLGQKLKMPKRCEKPSYKIIRVVLCKKPHEKTPNIREMRQF